MVEGDDLVETVQELRGKLLAQALLDDGTGMLLVTLVHTQTDGATSIETDAATKLFQLPCTGIGGHDNHRVAEIDQTTVAVCQTSLVEHLQQKVEHVAVGFLYLVEQDDGVGVTAHTLGQLTTLLITDVSRRGTNQTRHIEPFRIFAHVDTYQVVGAAKHILGQFLGQVSLTHTCRTEKHEDADGVVGLFQTHTVALDGFHHLVDGGILGDDRVFQLRAHHTQTGTLGLGHALHGHAGHHRHDVGHFFLCHRLTCAALAVAPVVVHLLKLLLKHQLAVAVTGCQLVILVLYGTLFLLFHRLYLLLLLGDLRWYLGMLQMYT